MWADLILNNANVITQDSSKPTAEAIAIKNDKIIKVGKTKEINSLINEKTNVINLNGKTVIPGFTDSHIHVSDFGKVLTWLNLNEVKSIKEMKKRITERTKQISKERWIIGNGWNQVNFVENRYPTIEDLNDAAPENPVIIYHQIGRVCLVNSKALEVAGVNSETIVPKGGEIEKNSETGELTGILRENATDLVWKKIPDPNEEELIEAIDIACKKIIESGVTSIHWIVPSASEVSIIQKLIAENKLPLRVYVIIPEKILSQLEKTDSLMKKHEKFGIKIFVDGSLAARTAALYEPYIDDPKSTGQLLYSQEKLNKIVNKAHKENYNIVMHAMGDKAISMALNAIEKALILNPQKNHRHRIEHASVLNEELIQRIKKLKMIVSIQPKCVISEFSVWSAENRLGTKRAKMLYPVKTLFKENITVIGGSDSPMEPISPLSGIQAVVTRKYFPNQQIKIDQAITMYTKNPAYASFEEKIKGSIDEGKLADLTILSKDPQKIQPNKIEEINVNMTIIGGKIVYKKTS